MQDRPTNDKIPKRLINLNSNEKSACKLTKRSKYLNPKSRKSKLDKTLRIAKTSQASELQFYGNQESQWVERRVEILDIDDWGLFAFGAQPIVEDNEKVCNIDLWQLHSESPVPEHSNSKDGDGKTPKITIDI